MEDIMKQVLAEYGLVGLAFLGIGFYIWTSEKRVKKERTEMRTEHREEREKWAEQDQAKHVEMISSMQKNTEVLSGLKTLIGTIVK